MKEGTPVTWGFMILILIVYIGGYIWNLQKENDRLYEIATKQKELVEQLRVENEQLHELSETMFRYIDALESSPTVYPRNNSPIYNKPL